MLLRLAQGILRERRWGDESVVFSAYSGETHHLNALASLVFRRISAAGNVEFETLCDELTNQIRAEPAREIQPEDIGNIVAKLRDIGLIRIDEGEV